MLNKIEKKLYCTKKTKTYFSYPCMTILAVKYFRCKLYLYAKTKQFCMIYFMCLKFLFYSFCTNFFGVFIMIVFYKDEERS